MVGAILGGLSAIASGLSAIQNFQQSKQAERAANLFGNQLANIKETNVFRGIQSPDISGLQAQQTAAQTAQATQAIQGMGPEGAAQAANIYQAGLQQNAENMQRQAQMDYNTQIAKAQAEQDVQFRNVQAQRDITEARLMGAQQKASDTYNAGMAGIQGVVGGLGMAAGDIAGLSAFDNDSAELKAKIAKRKADKSKAMFGFDQSTPAYMGEFDTLPG